MYMIIFDGKINILIIFKNGNKKQCTEYFTEETENLLKFLNNLNKNIRLYKIN